MSLVKFNTRQSFLAGFVVLFSVAGSNLLAVGSTLTVNAGGDFQAALDYAQLGDEIVLQAGASFNGPFILPNKLGTGEVVIRSSALDRLPEGARVTPDNADSMPKIVASDSSSTMFTRDGAHHFRFIGIEFKPAAGAFVYNVISINPMAGEWTNVGQVPRVTFDLDIVPSLAPDGEDIDRSLSIDAATRRLALTHVPNAGQLSTTSDLIRLDFNNLVESQK